MFLSFVNLDFVLSGVLSSLGMPIFTIAILLLISLLDFASVIIIFLMQQNFFILQYYFFSSSVYFESSSFSLLTFNTFLFLTNIFIRYCLQCRPLTSCHRRLAIYSSSNLNALINLPPALSDTLLLVCQAIHCR